MASKLKDDDGFRLLSVSKKCQMRVMLTKQFCLPIGLSCHADTGNLQFLQQNL